MDYPPWSVKGVEPEAREAAKIAARRVGLTVGQWLSQTIRATAAEQLRHGGRGALISEAMPSAGEARSAEGGAAQPPAPTMQAIFESIQKLSSRVEAAEARTADAIAPLAEQVDSLTREINTVKNQGGVSIAPVERAMTRLSERLQKIEEDRQRPAKRPGRWGFFGFSR